MGAPARWVRNGMGAYAIAYTSTSYRRTQNPRFTSFLTNYGSRIKEHQTPGANYLFYPSLLLTRPPTPIHKQFTNCIKFEHRFDTFDFYTKAISWNKEQLQLIWQMPISHFWYFFINLLFQKGGWIISRPFPFVKQPLHSITKQPRPAASSPFSLC